MWFEGRSKKRTNRYVAGYARLTQLTHPHSHSRPENDAAGTLSTNPTHHSPSKNVMTSSNAMTSTASSSSPLWVTNN